MPKDLILQNIIYLKTQWKLYCHHHWEKLLWRSIDDIKWYREIRKLTTGQGEDYTTGCLLDYDYNKNHDRLIAVDLSRQKEVDADPKAIQQTEFTGQLKKLSNNDNNVESMFILTILEKSKKQD